MMKMADCMVHPLLILNNISLSFCSVDYNHSSVLFFQVHYVQESSGIGVQMSILRLQLICFASEGVNQSPSAQQQDRPLHPRFIKKLKQSGAEEKSCMVPKTDGYTSTTASLTDMPL